MKRLIPLFLIGSLLLASCGALNPAPANPTPSDEQLATRVAQILTAMPSPTGAAQITQPPLPTLAPVVEASATTVPTEAPPPTAAPSLEPTQAPTTAATIEGEQSGGGGPAGTEEPQQTGGGGPAGTQESQQTGGGGPAATEAPQQTGGGGPAGTEVPQQGGGAPTDTPAPDQQQGGGAPGVLPNPATPTPPPTVVPAAAATLTATDPRLRLGNPSFTDTMDTGGNWPTGVDRAGFTSVMFANGQMQLTGLKTTSGWRLSSYGTDLRDFYIEMKVTPTNCTGNDRYGIFFRVPDKFHPDQGYWYGFTCDGRFALQKWDAETGPEGTVTNLIYWKANKAIKAGPAVTHRMGVMAIGKNIWLYADGQLVGQSSDSTWLQGAFGVFVGARETQNFTILVDQIDVWTNPVAP